MMTRLAAVAGLLLAGSAAAESAMTIVQTTTRTYPGFRARLTYQIGCATTGDYPSEETTRAAEEDQERRFKEIEPTLKRAFEFFARGDHPFTRFRKHLAETGTESEVLYWMDLQLTLFVRPDTPEILRKKLAFDFVLSLAFDPGLRRTTPFAYPTETKNNLHEIVGRYDWVSRLLAHACRHPEKFREWAAGPIGPTTDQYKYDEAHRLIKVKALQRVLERKPYGGEVFADAATLSRTESVRDLLLLSSDAQAPELKAVLDLLPDGYDAVKAYYEPLL
jgi:hypothetical protein